jgi:hypothetical protein
VSPCEPAYLWNLLSFVVSGRSWESVVSIVTRCGLGRPEIEFRGRREFPCQSRLAPSSSGLLCNLYRVFLGGKTTGFVADHKPPWHRSCEWVAAIYPYPLCDCGDMLWVTLTFTMCLEIHFHLVFSALNTAWGRGSSRGYDKVLSPTLKMKAAGFYHYIRHKLKECLNLHAKSISFPSTSACVLTTRDLLPHARNILQDSTPHAIILYIFLFCSFSVDRIPSSLRILVKVWQDLVILF